MLAPTTSHAPAKVRLAWGLAAVSALFLAGCSAADPSVSSGGSPGAGAVGTGTTGGIAGTTSGTGVLGGGGTNTGVSTPGGNGSLAGAGGASAPGGTGRAGDAGAGMAAQPVAIDQCGAMNPGQLSAAQVQLLKAGGRAGGARILYPYDGTVFPRGLKAPLLMWDGGGAAQALYVHIKSALFEYHGCLKPSGNGQLQLPDDVWTAIDQQARGPNDAFTLELTTLSGQTASGPTSQGFVVAQATLKGSIYYNSYNSQLAGGFGQNSAILRLRPGRSAELFLRQDTCTGCHSVSANGQRMVAKEEGLGIGGLFGGGQGNVVADANGQVYSLMENTAPNPAPLRAAAGTAFSGLVPNGKFYLSSAGSLGVGPLLEGASQGFADSILYETDTGNVVAGTGIPKTAMMPAFSPDGTKLAFTDLGSGDGHGLALMDFDPSTGKAQGQRAVFTHSQQYPGWPFILPDNRGVVFSLGESADFSGGGNGIIWDVGRGPTSNLMLLDIASGKSFLLARAMGFRTLADAAQDKTYLPFGQEELHQSYYPTVSPVAGGGYFWIFFDSVRHYGNQGLHRQLWGAAIAVPASGGELEADGYADDPSYPAFYLSGQELPVANHRAFTALDPCRADGASCETGIDCCGGFCTNGKCGVDAPRCSLTNEVCKTDKDCCNPADACLGGFCGQIVLQ